MVLTNVLLIIICMLLVYTNIYFTICQSKKKNNVKYSPDIDMLSLYWEHLNTMIRFYTITAIEDSMGSGMSIDFDGKRKLLTNEELVKLHDDIKLKIIDEMSDEMRNALETEFGVKWISKYIGSTVLAILSNYEHYSLTDIFPSAS